MTGFHIPGSVLEALSTKVLKLWWRAHIRELFSRRQASRPPVRNHSINWVFIAAITFSAGGALLGSRIIPGE